MTSNVHDANRRAERFAQHVHDLGEAFGVHVQVVPGMPPHAASAGMSMQGAKMIRIAPVTDETTYAVALHELGHCLHPTGSLTHTEGSPSMRLMNRYSTLRDVRLELLEEESAWEWAHHYALEWTDLMTTMERLSADRYRQAARRFGVK